MEFLGWYCSKNCYSLPVIGPNGDYFFVLCKQKEKSTILGKTVLFITLS